MDNKLDLKKRDKAFYNPSAKEPVLIEVPAFRFLAIDGTDARPESRGFQQAIEALFGISYKIKFGIKKSGGTDYAVTPLEGLWWADDMNDFHTLRKERWHWTLMIRQPDFVTEEIFREAVTLQQKKGESPILTGLRLMTFSEGWCGQLMHVGPFSEEGPNIARIHEAIAAAGGSLSGHHHEIYLNDFRKVDPSRMKTVLRQPFVRESLQGAV